MKARTTGNVGFALMIAFTIVVSGVAFLWGPSGLELAHSGLCLPGPQNWPLNPNLSWAINVGLMIGGALALQLLNRTYNFIANTDTVMGCTFMLLCATNPYISGALNSSLIVALVNIIVLFILFDCFRINKSMNELFLAGTVLAIGSMVEYSSLVFILAVIVMAFMLECMTFRGIIALFIGLVAPYIIVIGLGLVPLTAFRMPEIETVFTYDFYTEGNFMLWLNAGLTILIFLLCSLYNAVGVYAGNTRRRRLCNCMMMLGWVAIIGILVDANNMVAYLVTLYVALSSQMANLFALHQLRSQYTLIAVIAVVYICSFLSLLGL